MSQYELTCLEANRIHFAPEDFPCIFSFSQRCTYYKPFPPVDETLAYQIISGRFQRGSEAKGGATLL